MSLNARHCFCILSDRNYGHALVDFAICISCNINEFPAYKPQASVHGKMVMYVFQFAALLSFSSLYL